jgi:hypothetical protein
MMNRIVQPQPKELASDFGWEAFLSPIWGFVRVASIVTCWACLGNSHITKDCFATCARNTCAVRQCGVTWNTIHIKTSATHPPPIPCRCEERSCSLRRSNLLLLGNELLKGDCFALSGSQRHGGYCISSYKSFHSGFKLLIKSIFFCREPPLICFSLAIAEWILSPTS